MYGHELSIALGVQTNPDQPATVQPLQWLPVISDSVGVKRDAMIQSGMRGVFDEGAHHPGPVRIEGEIELELDSALLTLLLRGMMSVTTIPSRRGNGVKTDRFALLSSDYHQHYANILLTLCRQWGDGKSNGAEYFLNMQMQRLSLSMVSGEFLKAKVGLIGGKQLWQTSQAPTYPPVTPWSWHQARCLLGRSKVVWEEVTELTIDIEDNLEPSYTLGSGIYPSHIKRSAPRRISVQGNLKIEERSEYEAFLQNSTRPLTLVLEGSPISQAGDKEQIEISIPNFQYQEFLPAPSGPAELEVSFSGKALRPTTGQPPLQIEITSRSG